MRLKRVRLSGFKSFAESTSAEFRDRFSSVVGPNGCGKSNILDAVRWVIGERSPRTIRSASMNDVIFSGAGGRGPCGRAAVELLFDNADGGFGGTHAARAEIAVRRELERDGDSRYFLFGERCRRRDVADLFLGTGLGDQGSYAIVGQGMVTRLVEAHPRELRGQLEEAAGISIYRERRRETESRLSRARDHLARIDDLRGELAQRLQGLSHQAEQARRHVELRAEERALRAGGFVLRYRALVDEAAALESDLGDADDGLSRVLSALRESDEERERLVERHRAIGAALERSQGRGYELGAEVARLESARGDRQRRALELQSEVAGLAEEVGETERQLRTDEAEGGTLRAELECAVEELSGTRCEEREALAVRQRDEERLWATQARWEEASESAAASSAQAQGLTQRLESLRDEAARLAAELQRLAAEEGELPAAATVGTGEAESDASAAEDAEPERALRELLSSLPTARAHIVAIAAQLHKCRCRIEDLSGQRTVLDSLLAERLPDNPALRQWLADSQLGCPSPLADSLELREGWERAVELVLGERLRALCVEDLDGVAERIATPPPQPVQLLQLLPELALPDDSMLCSKLIAPVGLGALLWGVHAAPNAAAARALLERLGPGESVVSRDGLWLGRGWMRVAGPEAGVLQLRERGGELVRTLEEARREEAAAEADQDIAQGVLTELEARAEQLREAVAQLAERRSELRLRQERAAAAERQRQQLSERRQRDEAAVQAVDAALPELQERAGAAELQAGEIAAKRDQLAAECRHCREAMVASDGHASAISQAVRRLALDEVAKRSRLESLTEAAARLRERGARLAERQGELARRRAQLEVDEPQSQEQLQRKLELLRTAERERDQHRAQLLAVEEAQRASAERRVEAERGQQSMRDQIERQRVRLGAIAAEKAACSEQVATLQLDLDELLREPPELELAADWEQQLARIERRIVRLGPVNLAAEAEHSKQLERKEYLDGQRAEADAAMSRLQGAIAHIDTEAKRRFKEAFQAVTEHLGRLFPHLFGGGSAELRLEDDPPAGEDPGILVWACPPGKKRRNIRQLSGGEKSLTAIALVFSLFRLNPAPFCMLDEVDAQLDDVNAGRFADLVQEVSKEVQVICISHNRIVMERAAQLLGVTMSEPGVSRLVSVDLEQALSSAEEAVGASAGG